MEVKLKARHERHHTIKIKQEAVKLIRPQLDTEGLKKWEKDQMKQTYHQIMLIQKLIKWENSWANL